jgi:hypothetical protein
MGTALERDELPDERGEVAGGVLGNVLRVLRIHLRLERSLEEDEWT